MSCNCARPNKAEDQRAEYSRALGAVVARTINVLRYQGVGNDARQMRDIGDQNVMWEDIIHFSNLHRLLMSFGIRILSLSCYFCPGTNQLLFHPVYLCFCHIVFAPHDLHISVA